MMRHYQYFSAFSCSWCLHPSVQLRCVPLCLCFRFPSRWFLLGLAFFFLTIICRDESGGCSDVTSAHGAWRHAGVRFLLSGVLAGSCRFSLGVGGCSLVGLASAASRWFSLLLIYYFLLVICADSRWLLMAGSCKDRTCCLKDRRKHFKMHQPGIEPGSPHGNDVFDH